MKNIIIEVEQCVGKLCCGMGTYICENDDYFVTFRFDSEWDDVYGRIARFVYRKDHRTEYKDVFFLGDTVCVPRLGNVSELSVGVYAESSDEERRICSTAVRILCAPSVLSAGVPHSEAQSEAPLALDRGLSYALDEQGNYLADEQGNYIVIKEVA